MRNLSYENQFSSQVHSNANLTHFHMKGFALGLVLKKRQKATRKWPISIEFFENSVKVSRSYLLARWLHFLIL